MKYFVSLLMLPYLLIFSSTETQAQLVQTNAPKDAVILQFVTAPNQNDSTNLFAGTTKGIFLSTDDGTSWNAISAGVIDTTVAFAVVPHGSQPSEIFAAPAVTYGGIFLSTDNGASWSPDDDGLTDGFGHTLSVNCIVATPIDTANTAIYAGTSYGVFCSTTDSTRWTEAGLQPESRYDIFPVTAIAALSGGGPETNAIVAGSSYGIGVFVSSNNGKTWSTANNGLINTYGDTVGLVNVFATTESETGGTNVFAGTGDGVFLSTDNGRNWQPTTLTDNFGVTDVFGNPISITSLATYGTDVFAGSVVAPLHLSINWNGDIFLSTDNGGAWTLVDSVLNPISLGITGKYIIVGDEWGDVWRRPLSEIVTKVKTESAQAPKGYSLDQNYPNPFNPSTTVKFDLKENSTVTLSIFNVLGQRVQDFNLGRVGAGTHSQVMNMSRFPSGVYFYRIEAVAADGERFISMKKMVVIK